MGTARSDSAPGTWRESDGAPIAFSAAKTAWADAARMILIDLAGRYRAYTTYAELAEDVQKLTGIRTRSQMRNWIGSVLGMVAEECIRRREPHLTSLCVRQDGTVGEGYAYVIQLAKQPRPEDLDQHAAESRLECYRHFEANLPPDGGRPTLTPQVAERRRTTRAIRQEQRPVQICPQCFVALPATGTCDNCS